jgi:hypothetical protein
MAIEKTYLLGKNITLGCGFDLQAKAPLDSRQVVPEYDGLQALIDGNAAYEGMIVYDEGTKKTYQAQLVDGVLAFREFGINEAELKALIASETTAAMEFKGAATALPENPSKGDFYKVTTSFDVAEGETAKVGDSIVYDGEQWFIIPSGDDIEDTWRPVTDVDNDAALTFVAGDKLEKTVAADGTITYKHAAIEAPADVTEEGEERTRTYITAVETDGFGHITGFKTATENVEDTNTTYEFEGLPVDDEEGAPSSVYFQVKSSEEEAAEVIYLDTYSKNEADAAFKAKRAEALAAVETDANVFVDTVAQDVDGNITITTKAVDFTAVNNELDKKIESVVISTGDAAGQIKYSVDGAEAINVDVKDFDKKVDKVDGKGLSTNDLTDELKGQYDAAYAHSQVAHAPADAQANIIESVKVNGTALTITDKAVDITVPTGALASKDEVAKDDLAEALATEIDSKVASVTAGDASVTIGGTATAPTVAAKISAAEGNALTLAADGLKVIIPESTKVEASETNGNIKVDGEEVTVYTHPEKHAIADIDGLGALATKDTLNKIESGSNNSAGTNLTVEALGLYPIPGGGTMSGVKISNDQSTGYTVIGTEGTIHYYAPQRSDEILAVNKLGTIAITSDVDAAKAEAIAAAESLMSWGEF